MVTVSIDSKDMERGIFLHGLIKYFQQLVFYRWNDELPAILGAPDDMILELVYAVIEGSNSHATSIARFACYAHSSPHSRRKRNARAGFPVRKKAMEIIALLI